MNALKVTMFLALIYLGYQSEAQRGSFDPVARVSEEKQNVLENMEDLTEDQQVVIDKIYEDHALKVQELTASTDGPSPEMREKMMKIRKEKNELMKDLLSEAQYQKYEQLIAENGRGPRGK
ncbi:MAG: hypothetical protein RIC30_03770 [Marinoscillum sp.]|uniref:hypothetical protein n=1 Tax=Marinoscillum sp. TaxID=2024838 RepID=UPI0032FBE6B8